MIDLASVRSMYSDLHTNNLKIKKPKRREVKQAAPSSSQPCLKAQEKVFNVIAENSGITRGDISIELSRSIEHTGLCIQALVARNKVSRKMIKLSGTARGYIHKIITE